MSRILVTSAGRSPALNFCRSLRLSGEDIFILGIDTNKYSILWAEADEKLVVPSCDHPNYIQILNGLIDKYKIDYIYPSKSDRELMLISENREKIKAKVFLPYKQDVRLFEDKWETYKRLKELNIVRLPETHLIYDENQLRIEMKKLSKDWTEEIWIRRIYGSGGAGSIATNDFELARAWINRHDGWGKFSISKKLTKKTLTWSALWKDGELITYQIRERLYWEFADRAPSGVTGITGGQHTIQDKNIDILSEKIVRSLSEKPNGVIGIDFTRDENGQIYLTEVQASRLYTSTNFMAKCGLNLPYILYKLALDKEITPEERNVKIDENLVWLKYVENFPMLTTTQIINDSVHYSEEIIKEILENE